ncbi:Penicillin-binding protein 1A [Polaribacter huanghezhanensis]|uniref:penicillin-binding protein 1A n=1 Tax=Polaribacter huanghezhanensis TaxID=1354726 RepID=UPI0026473971|nr:transglycosylase domain-containing protein [Polaribacter huanghezhanensis]WKD85460.1 Penicillin-binding protein 1A [Polaribacter huanghezhanensis]
MTKKKATDFKKYIKWFWGIVIGGFTSIFLLFLLASWGVFGTLPTFEELENPENNLATEIISSDGKTLGTYAYENRTPIQFKDLPKNLVQALTATEDERFYEHSGVDFKATARAIAKLGKDGGGSTITQQFAKILVHGEGSKNIVQRVLQKFQEYVIAVRLERQYTKQEILTMYLNKYDFLNQAVGIRSASRIYFGKEPNELKIEESAMLVGMLKNSSYFNPLRRKELVHNRRNVVLKQMEKNGFLTLQEKDSLQQLPLEINYTPESHSDGYATYFREYLREYLKQWVKTNPKPNGEKYNIYADGLKVYVTIDSRMQKYAEEAVKTHISNLQSYFDAEQKSNETAPFYDLEPEQIEMILTRAKKNSDRWREMKRLKTPEKEIEASFLRKRKMKIFTWKGDRDTIMTPADSIKYYKYFLHSGLMSMEPQTGHIKAWVGGINNKHFKYDHVEQGRRQVGSTFKPFVYATAINQLKLSPCDRYPIAPYTIKAGKYGNPESWTPRNSGENPLRYKGELSLKEGLANSVNTMSARLIDMVGPKNVARLAKQSLGITRTIPETPSIALGTVELSLYEMVSAYAMFANKGLRVEPMMITRIEDKNGTVLTQFTPKTQEVLSEESAYVILDLLKGVTISGSGIRLRTTYPRPDYVTGYPYGFQNPIAGKTGTTQNHTDGWFMGVVPNLATGVWTGGEDNAIHFETIGKGQGASMSLPTWAIFMRKCYEDPTLNISKEDFEKPENPISIRLDCGDVKKVDEKEIPVIKKGDTDF